MEAAEIPDVIGDVYSGNLLALSEFALRDPVRQKEQAHLGNAGADVANAQRHVKGLRRVLKRVVVGVRGLGPEGAQPTKRRLDFLCTDGLRRRLASIDGREEIEDLSIVIHSVAA